MLKGKLLNSTEKGIITRLKCEGNSNRNIAKTIGRSRTIVDNFIKGNQKKKIGRPKKLSEREKRSILRVASNAALSYNQIKSKSGVNCNRSTVRRIIET